MDDSDNDSDINLVPPNQVISPSYAIAALAEMSALIISLAAYRAEDDPCF